MIEWILPTLRERGRPFSSGRNVPRRRRLQRVSTANEQAFEANAIGSCGSLKTNKENPAVTVNVLIVNPEEWLFRTT